MPLFFPSPITTPQLNRLRGIGDTAAPFGWAGWWGDQYVSMRPNTTIFKARVNGAITGQSYNFITYDNVTIGDIADVRPHFRTIVSPTDNTRDSRAITLRTRDETHTSSILYTSEDSRDVGDDWYLFVIEDAQLTDKLARPLSVTEQRKDYDDPFERLAPVVDGLESVYIGYVDPDTGVMTIDIDVSDSYAADHGSWLDPLDFQFTFKSGTYTVTAGDLDEDSLTVEIEEGHQIAQLVITDSNGVSWLRYFDIFAHGDTFAPVMGFDGAGWSGEQQNGYTANAVAFTDVDDVLNETFTVIWRPREFYNGVKGELVDGRNIDFIGWINREENSGESDETHSFLSEVSFEFVGVGARMALLEAQMLALRNNLTPDEWDEIEQFYASWRGKLHIWQRHLTLLHLFPVAFSLSMKNTSFIVSLTSNQGGNALASSSGLAQSVNGAIEFAPDGRIQVVRDLRYMTALDHTDAIKVATFDKRDLFSIKESRNHFDKYGHVMADGAFYNASTGQMTAVRAIAPGHARGRGAEDSTLSGQILTETAYRAEAVAELAQRAANHLLVVNDDGNQITAEHPGGYFAILIPSVGHTYAWILDGTENVRGITYDEDTLWLLKSVQLNHSNDDGSRTCTAVYVKLVGPASAGDEVEEITPNEIEIAAPDIPPFGAFDFELPETMFPLDGLTSDLVNPLALQPPKGQVAKKDGSTVWIKSDDQSFLLQNVIILPTPDSYEVTPSDLDTDTIEQVMFDPLNTGKIGGNNYGYLLAYDGTNSKVKRASNIFGHPVSWLTGDDIAGLYNVLRGTNVDGGLMAYSPGGSNAELYTDDFGVALGSKSYLMQSGSPNFSNILTASGYTMTTSTIGHFVSSGGRSSDGCLESDSVYVSGDPGNTRDASTCIVDIGAAHRLVGLSLWRKDDTLGRVCVAGCAAFDGSGTLIGFVINDTPSSTLTWDEHTWSGTVSNVRYLWFYTDIDTRPGAAKSYLDDISFTYADDDAVARYSDDRGDSWGSEITVGAFVQTGGFDAQRSGPNTFAACSGKVRRATTLGGAYSDYYTVTGGAQAVCVIVPYFNWAGVKQTSATHPDIVVALNQADGSGRTLLWIEGGATPGTVHDITPVAGITFDNPNCVTMEYETNIAVVGTVSGNRRCYATINQGGAWNLRLSGLSSDAKFIRCRRGDTRAKDGGNNGQIYVIDGSTLHYSYDWGLTFGTRTMPIAADGMDILG